MNKLKATLLALCLTFALTTGMVARAQEQTPVPTPTIEELPTPAPDTTTTPEPVTSTVQAFLLTAGVFGGLAVLAFVFWQQGKNLKVVAGTVPPELAQLAFRVAMQQANATVETYDDEALKTLAVVLGYDVVPDGRGGYTITASPVAVAQNVEKAKEDYLAVNR